MMSSITIATTEKNKPLLICKGFNYTIDRINDKKTYWKCKYCRTMKCKGRMHTDIKFTTILNEIGIHKHPEVAANTEVRLFNDKVRSRATNTNESTQNVIDNCLKISSDQMVARLLHFKYIKRNIQRQRNDLLSYMYTLLNLINFSVTHCCICDQFFARLIVTTTNCRLVRDLMKKMELEMPITDECTTGGDICF